MLVFGGGCALAGLAGVIGGNYFITDPGMARMLGPIVFVVVVVGGMGSLTGAFVASLLLGAIQTFAVGLEYSLTDLFMLFGVSLSFQGRHSERPFSHPNCSHRTHFTLSVYGIYFDLPAERSHGNP